MLYICKRERRFCSMLVLLRMLSNALFVKLRGLSIVYHRIEPERRSYRGLYDRYTKQKNLAKRTLGGEKEDQSSEGDENREINNPPRDA